MRKVFLSILMLVSVASFAQTADEVIANHIAARGGADKLNAVKTLRMVADMSVAGMSIPVKMVLINGVGMRMELNAMGSDIVTVVDSTGGWAINPMGGSGDPVKGNASDLKGALTQIDITGGLLNYKEKGHSAELVGKEAINGNDAFKIKLKLKNSAEVTYFFDSKTYNLVKNIAVANLGGQEFEASTFYSNHKAVDGVVFPMDSEVSHPQFGTMATTYKTIEVNPAVDSTILAFPKK